MKPKPRVKRVHRHYYRYKKLKQTLDFYDWVCKCGRIRYE